MISAAPHIRSVANVVYWVGLIALVTSCGSPDADSDRRYLVMDYDAERERYETVESQIETLDDARAVSGDIAFLRGGGNLVIGEPAPQTEGEFADALRIENDNTPRVSYEVDGGRVTAWDFDSLLMLTLYHHLERAAFYFEEIGVGRDVVGQLPVYYAPSLSFIIPVNLLTDNAAYAFTMDALLFPRQMFLSDLPLAANRGVIVHEYSHAVFNRLVHGDARAPQYLVEPWPDAAINRMRALDEGVADIFGALAVGDPNFISPSISEEEFDIDRDVSRERHYTQELERTVVDGDPARFNPYILGSVVASTVWALRPHVDDTRLGRAVVDALVDFSTVGPAFDLSDFFDSLHAHLPTEAQPSACTIFTERLTAISEQLTCAE